MGGCHFLAGTRIAAASHVFDKSGWQDNEMVSDQPV
jgi:hypothetical protein